MMFAAFRPPGTPKTLQGKLLVITYTGIREVLHRLLNHVLLATKKS